MSKLSLDFSWREAPGSSDPAILHTMADLSIRVDDEPVTRVFDRKSRTTRDTVFVSLYPLAEWIAARWWPLLEENLAPQRGDSQSFDERHSLAHAGDGFALPRLTLVPEGESTLLRWEHSSSSYQHVEFLGDGEARVPKADVSEVMSGFVEAVTGRLESFGVADTWLEKEWKALRETDADAEEADFCRMAAYLGLDPFDVADDVGKAIVEVASSLPDSIVEDVFRCASVSTLKSTSDWVLRGIEELRSARFTMKDLGAVRKALQPLPSAAPWEQGYELARQFRRQLDLSEGPLLDLSPILGPNPPLIRASTPSLPGLDGLVRRLDGKGFSCFTSRTRSESVRFLLARALCLYLEHGDAPLSVLSGAVTQRQKRNRAFAAELLAPAKAIQKRLPSEMLAAEDIEEVACEFGVSSYVVEHQIVNHHLGTIMGSQTRP